MLSESKQLFAAKYVTYLPTEEELVRELQREWLLIEARSAVAEQPPRQRAFLRAEGLRDDER